ncbi:MAG: hypothetical protein JWP15_2924, partial [Alphaproteobacteria bacterium]|nr:hypothetical protein [Alphaproteobacteria bacterium]
MSGTSATNGVNLNGGSKNDILNGGSGNDHISGGAGNDVINGGAGSDNLDGGSGDDTIAGGDGNDDINGASGNDIIDGGTGDDDISGDSGDDVIDGGAGSDNVDAGSGNDTMIYVVGQNGLQSHDDYEGGSGIDTLRLVMTRDEWMNPFFQFDLLRVKLFLAGNSHNGGWNDCDSDGKGDFQFIAFGLHVSDFEKLEIVVDGKVMDLSDQAVTLKADSIIASEDSASIAFDVLANDSVPDLVKSITFTQAAHGLVTWAAGQPALTDPAAAAQAKLIYTPDPNYYQYLAKGQTATDTFTYKVTDADGDVSTATVTVTITGANDAPVLAADTTALHALTEMAGVTGGAGVDTSSATLGFTDVDLTNTHVVTTALASSAWSGGAALPANLTAALGGALSMTKVDSTGTGTGSVKAAFSLADKLIDFLAAGETLTLTYAVTVTDNDGGSATRPITFVITGTNDEPVITSPAAAAIGAVAEAGNLDNGTAVAGTPSATGTLTSTDVDHNATATWSGTAAGTYGAFAIDATTGKWTYTLNNGMGGAADQLAEGESRTETFLATVTDDKGAIATQIVTINVTGTNDSPVITSSAAAAAGAVTEAGNLDNGAIVAGTPCATGALASADVDHGATATWTGNAAGAYGAFAIDAATGKWTYTLDNSTSGAADHLAEGESRTETFLATVTDDKGAIATQTVTVTITGSNDSPVITSTVAAALGAATEAGNLDGGQIVAGTPCATGQLASSDVDHGAAAAWSGNAAGTYGAFAIDSLTGKWTYTLANGTGGAADQLAEGESRTESFLATVTDDKGAIATQLVTVTIAGTNDSPVITSTIAAASGAVIEAGNLDAGAVVA